MIMRATIRSVVISAVHAPQSWKQTGPDANASSGGGGAQSAPHPQPPRTVCPALKDARILVVNDELSAQYTLLDELDKHGLRPSLAVSRETFASSMSIREPDLVLLDLQRQDDGFDLLREIRMVSCVPVIVTVGPTSERLDRIVGLELGADDCLVKPFDVRELLARIHAILRRTEIARNAPKRTSERGGFRFAGWELRRRSRQLIAPSGEKVPLTNGEYALLVAFLSAPERPLSRERLLQATRVHEDVFDRSIDVQVLRLRRKLEIDPATPRFIRTKRGVGYVFAASVETF